MNLGLPLLLIYQLFLLYQTSTNAILIILAYVMYDIIAEKQVCLKSALDVNFTSWKKRWAFANFEGQFSFFFFFYSTFVYMKSKFLQNETSFLGKLLTFWSNMESDVQLIQLTTLLKYNPMLVTSFEIPRQILFALIIKIEEYRWLWSDIGYVDRWNWRLLHYSEVLHYNKNNM